MGINFGMQKWVVFFNYGHHKIFQLLMITLGGFIINHHKLVSSRNLMQFLALETLCECCIFELLKTKVGLAQF